MVTQYPQVYTVPQSRTELPPLLIRSSSISYTLDLTLINPHLISSPFISSSAEAISYSIYLETTDGVAATKKRRAAKKKGHGGERGGMRCT